ncbi:MAG: arsenate reductase ArsC [Hyphomicrobiales bacterium]
MTQQPLNVLFLCNTNTTCSIIAEAVMNRLSQTDAAGRFKAYSASSFHRGMVHPHTLHLLANNNYDPNEFRSKNWQEFAESDAPTMDFIFTLTDEITQEACPSFPGLPLTAHWSVPDPAMANGTNAEIHYAFSDTLRMIEQRVSIFVNLPHKSLDKLTLQQRIDDIGNR